MATQQSAELEKHDAHAHHATDPHAEPSEAWGWHGEFPRATRAAGWICAAIMFIMLIGNHRGWNEDVWLIVLGSGMVGVLLLDKVRRRTSWRR
ncbi:DUF2631 domain-containing protein [Allokutzneria sp. A3M-2-11 16]|uniref:DUF2631 domain-containing protein n=1 Tax=Allokutzneria sp. A3M-2-11 16 TaxID=2962043 RepID=UPI0020B7C0ED|nr:DUF2631 domain-containing protein [Allokutzneria sp. A3M-2-11 16]MCP3797929.1 DUF2631 domain-containing protein [Allokutzneria sp. A3M-2-11 16]